MSELTKFWMVYGIGQREPRYQHHSKDAARGEALRLAGVHPGITFVVLAAVDAFRAKEPKPKRVKLVAVDPSDEIPF